MYCGENQTALESQRVISDAVLELMREKNYADINIKEICTKAGVSRQTFYSLFETKDNVILYSMKSSCSHPEEAYVRSGKISLDAMSATFADFIMSNFELFQLLMDHGLEQLLNSFLHDGFFCCGSCNGLMDESTDILLHYFSGGMTGIIKCVVANPENKDQEFLQQTIKTLFSGEYFI